VFYLSKNVPRRKKSSVIFIISSSIAQVVCLYRIRTTLELVLLNLNRSLLLGSARWELDFVTKVSKFYGYLYKVALGHW
jgi:hypothetical protein